MGKDIFYCSGNGNVAGVLRQAGWSSHELFHAGTGAHAVCLCHKGITEWTLQWLADKGGEI
jgi:hypothetical protein